MYTAFFKNVQYDIFLNAFMCIITPDLILEFGISNPEK